MLAGRADRPGGRGVTQAAAGPDAIATVDAGADMLVAVPQWEVRATGDLLVSSGLATMGFALPAAIAAALVHPGRRVVCLTGDGGLGMTLAELETRRPSSMSSSSCSTVQRRA